MLQHTIKGADNMIIPVTGVNSLADYKKRKEYLKKNIRPLSCPGCGGENTFWRHGCYHRKVFSINESIDVVINRFKCRACGIVVSCLFEFLTPYLQFTSSVVADSIQGYAEKETSYAEQAAELSDLQSEAPPKPSQTQIFRWVERLARQSALLLFQLQKELVMRNLVELVQDIRVSGAHNSAKARTETKKLELRRLSDFLEMALSFCKNKASALLEMHAFFLRKVESFQSIFCGRKLQLPTPHSMKCDFF